MKWVSLKRIPLYLRLKIAACDLEYTYALCYGVPHDIMVLARKVLMCSGGHIVCPTRHVSAPGQISRQRQLVMFLRHLMPHKRVGRGVKVAGDAIHGG